MAWIASPETLNLSLAVGWALVRERCTTLIELDRGECRDAFAGNCHWVGGNDVVLAPGAPLFEANLKALGYVPHLVGTSEFLKAGGSVFCLKMMCF